jgi:uncharacterized protein YbjT (DUF2867 family)
VGLNGRDLLLAGATGLVGGLLLRRLLATPAFDGTIYAPARRDPGVADPRLAVLRTHFAPGSGDLELAGEIETRQQRPLHAYVSCLGTTIRTAGSREAFIAVDRDLVLRTAQLAYDHGARHAVLVSSVGASRQSGNFYLRVKGEVEDAVEKIGFTRLDLIQPGLLLGDRAERRPAERVMQALGPAGNLLMQGGLKRYRSIPAEDVADAIVGLLMQDAPGVFSHHYASLRALASAVRPVSR